MTHEDVQCGSLQDRQKVEFVRDVLREIVMKNPPVKWTMFEALVELADPHERDEFRRLQDRYGGGVFAGYLFGPARPENPERVRYDGLWERLTTELMTHLRDGEFEAERVDLDRGAVSIPRESWRVLEPDFEESTASSAGVKFVGIRVWPKRAAWSSAHAERSCAAWMQTLVDNGCIPSSQDALWADAHERFPGLSNRGFLRIWTSCAPEKWKKPGRRRRT